VKTIVGLYHVYHRVVAATVYRAPSSASAYTEVRQVDVQTALHEIQICRSAVTLREVLLEGIKLSTSHFHSDVEGSEYRPM